MSSEFQKRVYEMEVAPPEAVWGRVSAALDEINSDSKLADKLYNAETEIPRQVWQKIVTELEQAPVVLPSKLQNRVILFRRVAAAAVIIGLILVSYFIFFSNPSKNSDLVNRELPAGDTRPLSPPLVEKKLPAETNEEIKTSGIAIHAVSGEKTGTETAIKRLPSQKSITHSIDETPVLLAAVSKDGPPKNKLEEKIFNKPIDDLSLVASNSNYLSMVSADGRLVKIPPHLAGLAPYLQQKPGEAEYLDILFEESVYWKDKFREWRQKMVESPVTPSVDNFFDMIGLMKTIQEN